MDSSRLYAKVLNLVNHSNDRRAANELSKISSREVDYFVPQILYRTIEKECQETFELLIEERFVQLSIEEITKLCDYCVKQDKPNFLASFSFTGFRLRFSISEEELFASNPTMIKLLLRNDITPTDPEIITRLLDEDLYGDYRFFPQLISQHPSLDLNFLTSNGKNLLLQAISSTAIPLIYCLLETPNHFNLDIKEINPHNDQNALHYAVRYLGANDLYPVCRKLMELGINVRDRCRQGFTPYQLLNPQQDPRVHQLLR